MSSVLVILSLLFSTSGVMCAAMALAWLQFGRERHVLFWALSYALLTVQWAVNALALEPGNDRLLVVVDLCMLVSSALLAIGARQRAGLRIYWLRLFMAGGVIALVILGLAGSAVPGAVRGGLASLFAGAMMIAAAVAVWPRQRAFTASERAFFATLLLFALFQVALVSTALMIRLNGETALARYHGLIALALPPLYLAMGIAAILVIAGDLAGQLRALVSYDQLTGILNRRGMEQAAAMAIANAKRQGRRLAVVICDLDSFKVLNDSHGHIAGDAALRAFAGALLAAVRKGDVVGRLGGDEFCVLLVDSSGNAAVEVMERVRTGLVSLTVDRVPDGTVRASFGIAEFMPGDRSLDDLIARADLALYTAKQQGRDRVSLWSEGDAGAVAA